MALSTRWLTMIVAAGLTLALLATSLVLCAAPPPDEEIVLLAPRLRTADTGGSGAASQGADIPRPAPRIAGGAWAATLKEHPRLYGSKAYLQALAKAKPKEYNIARTGNWLQAVGIANAVEGVPREKIEPFIATAKKHVAAGVTNAHQDTHLALTEVALTYDFFYDALSPEDRSAMIAWLNGHLAKFTADENAFHNSTLSKIECFLQIAYATANDNPRAMEFRDYAIKKLYEGLVAPALVEFGAGGGYTECGWYTRGCLWNLVKGLEMARRFDGYDGFAKAPRFFYQRLAYEMLEGYPGFGEYGAEHYAVEGDGANTYGGHTEYPRELRTVLAQYYRGSELARFVAAKRRAGSNPQVRLMDFLYEEDPDPAADLRTFPLAHAATGIGKVYARSDWSDDATWLRFECGPYWNQHQHFEAGNFEIFRHEPLATESGEYSSWGDDHALGYLIRTIAHNCILVHMPGEKWIQMRDSWKDAPGNDGGQINKWVWPKGNLPEFLANREAYHRGDLVAYDNRPEFLFVAGDCTPAYAPEKLRQWVRQIVFLRPGTFVIFDRVVSTRPEYAKTWLLHMMNEPEIEGAKVTIANGPGRLVSHTLLPERAAVQKVYGYTYGGKTYDPWPTQESPPAPKWRIEVRPPEPRTDDLFLHVMFTGEPEPVELLRKGKAVGARIGQAEVLFEGKVGGSLRVGGKKTPLKAGLKLNEYER